MSPERSREELESDLKREMRDIELQSWRLRVFQAHIAATEFTVRDALFHGFIK